MVAGEVFGGSTEREVRAEDTSREEEGFAFFALGGEEVELLEGFVDRETIGIGSVIAFEILEDVHLGRILTNFAIAETVHPASWVLPFASREEMAVPGVWHFGLGVIVPVFATTPAGMVGDFSNGDRGVSLITKVSGKGRMLNVFGSIEESAISCRAVFAGEESVARCSTSGGLDVVSSEGAAPLGERIDMRRVNMVGTVTIELGPEVIDADEENVGLGDGGQGEGQKEEKRLHSGESRKGDE